jgi:citrate lyase subunit beta/citryl-CoA lyase
MCPTDTQTSDAISAEGLMTGSMSSPTLNDARSFFIGPGTDRAGLQAAMNSAADAVVADLEDLVPPEQKPQARAVVEQLFARPARGLKLVRVNATDTEEYLADEEILARLRIDGIVVPKGTPQMIDALSSDGVPILALIESAQGVRLAYETAMRSRVVGLVIAPGDLSKDLRMNLRTDGQSLLYVRSKLVVDSAAAGVRPPVDIPSRSEGDALTDEVAYARSLGLWGKLCMKPGQAEVINAAFESQAPRAGN